MKFAGWYGVVVVVLIVVQWATFLATGAVPELQTAPWSIGFHLAAELILALTLAAGGLGVLRSRAWGRTVLLAGLGMAIYSEIASPGYFAQQGNWLPVGMFAVLLVGAAAGIRMLGAKEAE